MSGNRIGGKKAAAKNLARDPNWYAKIGAKGGRLGTTGGFAADVECNRLDCEFFKNTNRKHYIRNCAGYRGGVISRRKKVVA